MGLGKAGLPALVGTDRDPCCRDLQDRRASCTALPHSTVPYKTQAWHDLSCDQQLIPYRYSSGHWGREAGWVSFLPLVEADTVGKDGVWPATFLSWLSVAELTRKPEHH